MSPSPIIFEWSARQAALNIAKHRIGFDEAATAFDDRHAFIQLDELHSDDEPRQVLIGYSRRHRLLMVSFSPRANGQIRLIGARQATRKERRIYEETSRD